MMSLPLALTLATVQSSAVITVQPSDPEERAALLRETGPAEHGDWRPMSTQPRFRMAWDAGNVERDGVFRTVHAARAGGMDEVPGSYLVTRLRIDCETRQAKPLWPALLASSGANIFGQSVSEEFALYGPESGAARIAAVACDGEPLTGESFPTDEAFAARVAAAPETD